MYLIFRCCKQCAVQWCSLICSAGWGVFGFKEILTLVLVNVDDGIV